MIRPANWAKAHRCPPARIPQIRWAKVHRLTAHSNRHPATSRPVDLAKIPPLRWATTLPTRPARGLRRSWARNLPCLRATGHSATTRRAKVRPRRRPTIRQHHQPRARPATTRRAPTVGLAGSSHWEPQNGSGCDGSLPAWQCLALIEGGLARATYSL